MAYSSLKDFIQALKKNGELLRVTEELDPILEIPAFVDRMSKQPDGGKALLFEKPKGSAYPVLANAFGSRKRMSLALGVDDLEEHATRVRELIELKPPKGLKEQIQFLPKLMEMSQFAPKTVSKAPCQEVVEKEPDLSQLPVLKCWPGDGGRFITLPVVHTIDPKTGIPNAGMYRLQIFDKKTTAMHWHPHHDGAQNYEGAKGTGKRFEVAVTLGGDPCVTYAATAPLPRGIDEMLFAGFLRKKPVELVKCKMVELSVPADADFVLEGYVELGEQRMEGPFGDHRGFYSLPEMFPVFHVTCMTRREDPVYPTTVVGPPPMEDAWIGKASERIFLPVLQKLLPEIVDWNMPVEGLFHNLAIVSIDKKFPGHARKVMFALWGLGQMMLNKVLLVVDRDVDVQDPAQVLWKAGCHLDPKRDTVIVEGPLDILDFSSSQRAWGGKMGLDATRKFKEEGGREQPDELEMEPRVVDKITPLLKKYGLTD